MRRQRLNIAFFGSSLVSSYWNGAVSYYRGLLRALAARGHLITFYEPDAYNRQRHRDIPNPQWADLVVYPGSDDDAALGALEGAAKRADVLVKASGIGAYDRLLEEALPNVKRARQMAIYWDVEAPATLERLASQADDPLHRQLGRFDAVLTYGGGAAVIKGYTAAGARMCVPVYGALDPETHHPALPSGRYKADLSLLANRVSDRASRIERFLFEPARRSPRRRFLLGGSGWDGHGGSSWDLAGRLPNVIRVGHVSSHEHNVFNASALAVLNVSTDSSAAAGFSPASRIFEATGAGACLITDAWTGIEQFLEPGAEVLVAEDGDQVIEHLASLTLERAKSIGRAARRRVLAQHTYALRAAQVETLLCASQHALPEVRA